MKTRALKILAATKLLPLLLLLVLPAMAQAQTYYYTDSYGTWSYTPNTGPVTITGYSGPGGALTIPTTINGYPVTSIGYEAFYENSSLSSVIIPDSVTSIGEFVFYGCTSLTSARIGTNVTSIAEEAFGVCSSLISITIPAGVTSIGVLEFYGCNSLTNAIIGTNVTSIGSYAFSYSGVRAVYFHGKSPIPTNDSTVFMNDTTGFVFYLPGTTGWGATFDGWPTMLLNLSGNAANLTYVTNNNQITITGYSSLTYGDVVVIPETIHGYPVTSIADNAFAEIYYGSITSVTIPDTVTSIGGTAFGYCHFLTSVTIGNGVTSIGNSAFYDCPNLASVTIGTNVTSIAGNAFYYCTSLTSVTIPASVTIIENGYDFVFSKCSSLTNINVAASNPDYSSLNGVLFDKSKATLVAYPPGLVGAYTIPASVTTIGLYAFAECYNLTSVTIGTNVTSTYAVNPDVFQECTSLTNINVVASNPGYSSLSGVLFNKSQTTLVAYPAGLAGAYTIPANVTNITDQAFYYCTSLTSVTIGTNVTSIGESVFGACSSLINVTIPDSVTSIGYDAFENCSSLTSVTIPDSVTNDLSSSFWACTSLTSATIGTNVTSIGQDAFYYCTSLTNITIPASVTNIASYAFDYDTSLTGVYFLGNSPTPTNDLSVFSGDSHGVAYYLPGTTGWGTLFDGLPTMLLISNSVPFSIRGGSVGVGAGGFGFSTTGTNNQIVVVEAATNLANPVWIPVSTNTLTGGTSSFTDPHWTNYPGRFYRLRSP